MTLRTKEALDKLEDYIAFVKAHPSLLEPKHSSFINDHLYTFVHENSRATLCSSLQSSSSFGFSEFFAALPDDQQYNFVSFLNFKSILALGMVNKAFAKFMDFNGLFTGLSTSTTPPPLLLPHLSYSSSSPTRSLSHTHT